MPALFAVHWVVLIVKVQNVLLCLEAELLIQEHGRVAGGDMKSDVLAHTCLHGERKPYLELRWMGVDAHDYEGRGVQLVREEKS